MTHQELVDLAVFLPRNWTLGIFVSHGLVEYRVYETIGSGSTTYKIIEEAGYRVCSIIYHALRREQRRTYCRLANIDRESYCFIDGRPRGMLDPEIYKQCIEEGS